jgi:hypothetical protein
MTRYFGFCIHIPPASIDFPFAVFFAYNPSYDGQGVPVLVLMKFQMKNGSEGSWDSGFRFLLKNQAKKLLMILLQYNHYFNHIDSFPAEHRE